MAFAHAVFFRDQQPLRPRNNIKQCGIELRDAHIGVSPNHVDSSIVIEQHAQVMEAALHRRACPRALRVRRSKHLRHLAIDVRKNIERAIVIAKARRPDSLAVNALSVFKTIFGAEVEFVERIRFKVPVDQVARVQHRKPRHHVHRRAQQIEVAADADDIWIGKLIVEDRIRVGPVPVVGSPCLRRAGMR